MGPDSFRGGGSRERQAGRGPYSPRWGTHRGSASRGTARLRSDLLAQLLSASAAPTQLTFPDGRGREGGAREAPPRSPWTRPGVLGGAGARPEAGERRPRAGPSLPRSPRGKPFRALSRLIRARRPRPQGRHCNTVHVYKAGMWGSAQAQGYLAGLPPPGPVADRIPIGSNLGPETHVSPPLGPLPTSEAVVTRSCSLPVSESQSLDSRPSALGPWVSGCPSLGLFPQWQQDAHGQAADRSCRCWAVLCPHSPLLL